jgi:uncharacterized DUF497 family protein
MHDGTLKKMNKSNKNIESHGVDIEIALTFKLNRIPMNFEIDLDKRHDKFAF